MNLSVCFYTPCSHANSFVIMSLYSCLLRCGGHHSPFYWWRHHLAFFGFLYWLCLRYCYVIYIYSFGYFFIFVNPFRWNIFVQTVPCLMSRQIWVSPPFLPLSFASRLVYFPLSFSLLLFTPWLFLSQFLLCMRYASFNVFYQLKWSIINLLQ